MKSGFRCSCQWLLLALLAIPVSVACGQSDGAARPEAPSSAANAAANPAQAPEVTPARDVELKWSFQPGRKLNVEMQQELRRIEHQGRGISESLNNTLTAMEWQVLSVQEDGSARIQTVVNRVVARVGLPDGKFLEYDSRDPGEPTGNVANLAAMFQPMLGLKTLTTMKPNGEVVEVAVGDGTSLDQIGNSGGLDQASLIKLMTDASPAFPARLSSGDQWQKESFMPLPFGRMMMNTNYQYEGVIEQEGKKLHRVKTVIEIKFEIDEANRNVTVDLIDQKNSGQILFDAESGRIVLTSMDQDITMEVRIGNDTTAQSLVQSVQTRFSE